MTTPEPEASTTQVATPATAARSSSQAGPPVLIYAVAPAADGDILLVMPESGPDTWDLPSTSQRAGETPARALVRGFAEDLAVPLREAGPLLVLDTEHPPEEHPGTAAHATLTFVFDVEPFDAVQRAMLTSSGRARFLPPDDAAAALPPETAALLREALQARRTGTITHLEDGARHAREPGPGGLLSHSAYIAERPKVLASTSLLCTAHGGQVLLVKPTYLPEGMWLLPGGSVESDEGESPRVAARRETVEELGLDLEPGRLLSVDWVSGVERPPMVVHTYDGGELTQEQLQAIELPADELSDWRLWAPEELDNLRPGRIGERISASLTARNSTGGPVELLDSRNPAEP